MTVPRWDAQTASRRFAGEPETTPARGGRKRKALWATLAALTVAAVAVSATQAIGDDRIGVCHATGSATEPHVFLVVKDDGFEHGHHRHHEGDFFVSDLSRGCAGDEPVVPDAPGNETPPSGNETPEAPAGNETPPAGNETPEQPAGNETPPVGNETPEAPTGNETPPAGNGTPEEPAGNGTEEPAQNGTSEPAPAGDAAVRQSVVQDDFAVVLTLRVLSAGPGVAQDVTLDDQLPDVRRTWQLAGADAQACVLDGRSLSCWFGDLPAGQERVVELRSYIDRMPCGFALTNTAFVAATDDAEPRNDASSASIAARAC